MFFRRGENRSTGKIPLKAEKRIITKLYPHERPSPGIEARVTLVGGEGSHHHTIPAPLDKVKGLVAI